MNPRPHRDRSWCPSTQYRSAALGRLRRRIVGLVGAVAVVAAPAAIAVTAGAPAGAQTPGTVVSLTFDDGNADMVTAADILEEHGLRGTFFVPSGYVGQPGFLSLPQLQGIEDAGHEIGGHSVTHAELPSLSRDEAARQICNDRVNLTDWGFDVTSFAYPYAAANPDIEALVRGCGYNSARGLGGVESHLGCEGCGFSESIPPANPFHTKAPAQVDDSWTLDDLQSLVTNAEDNGGGWVQITFHHVCDSGCGPLTVTPTVLDQFASWLTARADGGTTVRTVADTVGGATAPATPGPVAPLPVAGANGVRNASLETVGRTGVPECWILGGYGTNTARVDTVPDARSGSVAARLTVTNYVDGDAKLMPALDLGECAPGAVPGHTYDLSAWYKSTATTQFAVYYRTTTGTWTYWTSGPWLDPSDQYAVAEWTTPALPAGATGISFGLNLFGNGELHTDDYSIVDTAAPPAPSPSGSLGSSSGRSAPDAITTLSELAEQFTSPGTNRTERLGPADPETYYVPGPGNVRPGQTFLPDTGRLLG